MLIRISDSIHTSERKRLLKILPILFALKKFNGDVLKSAQFLGRSQRSIRNNIDKYHELKDYRGEKPEYDFHGRRIDRMDWGGND